MYEMLGCISVRVRQFRGSRTRVDFIDVSFFFFFSSRFFETDRLKGERLGAELGAGSHRCGVK